MLATFALLYGSAVACPVATASKATAHASKVAAVKSAKASAKASKVASVKTAHGVTKAVKAIF